MVLVKRGSVYILYSRRKSKKTGKRRRLGKFRSRKAALARERQIRYFSRGR